MTSSQEVVRTVSTLAVAGVLVASGSGVATAALPAAPTVSSLSSVSGPVGGHGKLTVHGSGFTAASAVLFGGAKGGSVHVVSSHVLTVVVPAHKAARLTYGWSPRTARRRPASTTCSPLSRLPR